MRGQYEAYILVKIKDGRQYVCGMNRPVKPKKDFYQLSEEEQKEYLNKSFIWN